MSWVLEQGLEPEDQATLLDLANSGDAGEDELRSYGYVPGSVAPRSRPKARISPALRKQVYERDGYRCVDCGGWLDLTCDHVEPEIRGGPTTLENLRTRCRSCNSRKGIR